MQISRGGFAEEIGEKVFYKNGLVVIEESKHLAEAIYEIEDNLK